MISITILIMVSAVTASEGAPSRGDTYRTIATDREVFAAADTNNDGEISDYEFENYYTRQANASSGRATSVLRPISDTNRDGALTPDELYGFRRPQGYDGDDGYYYGRVDYGDPYDE